MLNLKSAKNFSLMNADPELKKKVGVVKSKMAVESDLNDLSLEDKMKRHQCLIAALKEYAIMLDVCKRGGTA